MLAALAGHEQIATLLLEHGADPCSKTVDGSTALMIAVSKGNKHIVNSLLAFMRTRFLSLQTKEMRKKAYECLSLSADRKRTALVNEARKDGWTALMIAATKGEGELVRLLTQHGADINRQKTGDGCTGTGAETTLVWEIIKD